MSGGSLIAESDEIRKAARRFVEHMWDRLTDQRILPIPEHARFLRVGRDYFVGDDPEPAATFEKILTASYPRFDESRSLGQRDFPSPFVFSFLQACLARVATDSDGLTLTEAIFESSLGELLSALEADDEEAAAIRTVAHLGTHDDEPMDMASIRIQPIVGAAWTRRAVTARAHERLAFGAGEFIMREPRAFTFSPPESVVSSVCEGPDPFAAAAAASSRIDDFLLHIRLLYAATSQGPFEIRGGTGPVRRYDLQFVEFTGNPPGIGTLTGDLQRTTRLGPQDAQRVDGLAALRAGVRPPAEGMLFTPMTVATHMFTRSYHAYTWWDQAIGLATALEGAMGGSSPSAISLTLRTRSAALLATEGDEAEAIFHDIQTLYGLRSKLVHGSDLSSKKLMKDLAGLTTATSDAPSTYLIAQGIDRLRDLVRRALLCRIALATVEDAWPVNSDVGVDAKLADDKVRARWREAWRSKLEEFDAGFATDQATPGMETLYAAVAERSSSDAVS